MLKFIEKPREENLAAKNSFTSLLTNGEMGSVMGGGIDDCGENRAFCNRLRVCNDVSDMKSKDDICTGGFVAPCMVLECTTKFNITDLVKV
jgi:hypothetical protein